VSSLPRCLDNVRVAEIGKGARSEFFQVATTIFRLDNAAQRFIDSGVLGPRAEDASGSLNQFLIQLDLSGGHCASLRVDATEQN
jgi:hypothetical protein